jgi:hypothetical protein
VTTVLLTVGAVFYFAIAVVTARLAATAAWDVRPQAQPLPVWTAAVLTGLCWPAVLLGFLITMLMRRP